MILDIIKETIKKYSLINEGDSVLIGLSGGADSVCLTHALYSLRDTLGISRLYTAHLNHGIRGEEAVRDECFSKDFSQSLGIEYFTETVDIPSLAKENGKSEEEIGREIRYDFFERLCEAHNIKKIATAHNRNDNAETLLMNFIRGSSTNGLCGIPAKRGRIIRPISNIPREDIEKYCRENSLQYMTDSTNLENDYTRNKIRHKLIPIICSEFNPNFINTVSCNASLIKEDNDYIEAASEDVYKKIVKDDFTEINDILSVDIAIRRRVIRMMLKNVYGNVNDIPAGYISDVLKLISKGSGKSIDLKNNVTVKNEYGRLFICRKKQQTENFEYIVKPGESGFIREINTTVCISEANERKNDGAVYLSYSGSGQICIRNRREGDRFSPQGMTGTKKVKEYFIDKKVPRDERNSVPIIEIEGNIAAVGKRIDNNFVFKDKGIRIEFKKQEGINAEKI